MLFMIAMMMVAMVAFRAMMMVMAAFRAVMMVLAGIITDVIRGNDFYVVHLGLNLFTYGSQVDFVKPLLLGLFCKSQALILFFMGQFIDTLHQFFGYHYLHLSWKKLMC
jgi:hypothetical protein